MFNSPNRQVYSEKRQNHDEDQFPHSLAMHNIFLIHQADFFKQQIQKRAEARPETNRSQSEDDSHEILYRPLLTESLAPPLLILMTR
jgi:hypothetical protein